VADVCRGRLVGQGASEFLNTFVGHTFVLRDGRSDAVLLRKIITGAWDLNVGGLLRSGRPHSANSTRRVSGGAW
jgi:hypothetical protein